MAIFKKGDNYYIDYYFDGRRIREKVGPSHKQAQAALNARKGEIAQGKFDLESLKPTPVFKDFAETYLDFAKKNKRSWESDVNSLKHLNCFFGTRRLSEISPFLIEKYKLQRRETVKPATVNRELACLKYMFNLAIKWGQTITNPMIKVKLFKENNASLRYLSEEEIQKLIACSADHLKPILITAINTGMRAGEILHLRWDQVDFNNGLITVDKTKSGEARKIPMNEDLTRTLQKIKLQTASDSGYVFCKADGKPYGSVKKAFGTVRRKLIEEGIQYFRFHDLRHTFASHLVMNGVDLVSVKELLGHRTIKMTMRYAHLSQDHKRRAVASLVGLCSVPDGHYMDTRAESEELPKVVSY
jgi:integrase